MLTVLNKFNMIKLKSPSAKYQFGKKVSQGKVKAAQKLNYKSAMKSAKRKG